MTKKRQQIYIASCSFGKDSIATILLALEKNEPLERAVFAEVMFDISKGISGEIPEHIKWVYDIAIPKLKNMGVKIDIVRSERDYMYFFRNKIKNGRYAGKLRGFPLGGMCVINRDCKLKPIKDYYRQFQKKYDIIQYVGIAIDEHIRLKRLNKNKISLLEKYSYTEKMAYELCEKYELLSPLYKNGNRGGCWFCPNRKLKQLIHLRNYYPNMWNALRELSKIPNLCSYGFKYGKTLQDIEKEMNVYELNEKIQLKLEL